MKIAIIDYGMGNVRSLMNAFEFLGEEAVVTRDVRELDEADRLVLPGVGAFGDAMVAIRAQSLEEPLTRLALEARRPILGVCLGMQLFAARSYEHGLHYGLGWLDAEVVSLKPKRPAKVPHVGWNALQFDPGDWLFAGVPTDQTDFYFVHSFHMICRNLDDRVATTDHGEEITAVVRHENLVAAQFHPEKSQDNGLQLLQNWLDHDFAC